MIRSFDDVMIMKNRNKIVELNLKFIYRPINYTNH